ncbi:MAG: tRNA 2-thiocytidine(32) synthetase TtcA [Candidatus Omnitrophica bacterium]|nr:tRNA 2-thiocytidine(32) synthetase TtcA [Candidatus Omnitrophota bacterium]
METAAKKIEKPKGKGFYLSKKVGKAIMDYQMISPTDRILVAVSGGKDSFVLLKILRDRLSFSPVKYDLLAAHIDLMIDSRISNVLKDYFEKNGYNYYIEKLDLFKNNSESKIDCFWCSWNRRKILFQIAGRFNCNKVALGHHMDDIVETILLNLFFNGEISAMSPIQSLFEGKLTIIRPLAYVEEREIVSFYRNEDFPKFSYHCPHAKDSQRGYIKKIIKGLEYICPDVKINIFRAIKRIKKDYLL